MGERKIERETGAGERMSDRDWTEAGTGERQRQREVEREREREREREGRKRKNYKH